LGLLLLESDADGEVRVARGDISQLREAILGPRFNYGAPRVAVSRVDTDGSLELMHDSDSDGRGLDLERAKRVLDYVAKIWRRPVRLHTVDGDGESCVITATHSAIA
jgi:stage V sporulation protein R